MAVGPSGPPLLRRADHDAALCTCPCGDPLLFGCRPARRIPDPDLPRAGERRRFGRRRNQRLRRRKADPHELSHRPQHRRRPALGAAGVPGPPGGEVGLLPLRALHRDQASAQAGQEHSGPGRRRRGAARRLGSRGPDRLGSWPGRSRCGGGSGGCGCERNGLLDQGERRDVVEVPARGSRWKDPGRQVRQAEGRVGWRRPAYPAGAAGGRSRSCRGPRCLLNASSVKWDAIALLSLLPCASMLAAQTRRPYPLNCRGGERLVFDTIRPPSQSGAGMKLSLTFIASPSAAGADGQGLEPSTCAWVDRPVNGDEPRQVRFSPAIGDSTPQRTVRDSTVYWSFLAYNSDSGHFTGVGHRHWEAASPPLPMQDLPRASAPLKGSPRTINPRHLPWYLLGWVAIVWAMQTLTGMRSGWRRLAGLYPDRNLGRGRAFRCGPVVMGMGNYRGGVRLTPDDSYLHFSVWALLRAGHPPFSVPWSDITTSRDQWPWFPMKGYPVIRLTLAR